MDATATNPLHNIFVTDALGLSGVTVARVVTKVASLCEDWDKVKPRTIKENKSENVFMLRVHARFEKCVNGR